MTAATGGARTAYPSGAHELISGFSGVRVARSLGFRVVFLDRCFSFLAQLAKGKVSICHHLASVVR